jgi:hypothetical protein
MRALQNLLFSALAILSFGVASFGQDPSASIDGPILGFVEGSTRTAIRPIHGVLGASAVAQPLPLDSEIRNAIISPKHDYALATRNETGELLLMRLGSVSVTMNSVDGARYSASAIAISPAGTAAAIYGQDRILQLFTGLPDAPQIVAEFDVSDIAGHLQFVAVADDGALALLNFLTPDGASLWVLSANGSRWALPAQRASAASFLANRHDVVIADDAAQEVFLLSNIDQEASRLSVASFGDGFNAFAGVAASSDGLRVFISSKKSRNVTIADLETGVSTVLSCDCLPTGFRPLKGTSVFRLSDPADGPVAVLDASSAAEPRIIVLPVASAVTTPTPEEVQQQ